MDECTAQPNKRPSKADFAISDDDLDGMCAWENFAGLSRTEAYERFCDRPDIYQENFMFMGGVAFAYYFIAIERYILESKRKSDGDFDVKEMWILAHCIKIQFQSRNNEPVELLRQRCLSLVTHVRGNLAQYCSFRDEQKRMDEAWDELECVFRAAPGHR